jgi:hypothetical protein
MRKEIRLCDHCGKEIKEENTKGKSEFALSKLKSKGVAYEEFNMNFDLCTECAEEYMEERSKYMVYKNAFSGWIKKFVKWNDSNECKQQCTEGTFTANYGNNYITTNNVPRIATPNEYVPLQDIQER